MGAQHHMGGREGPRYRRSRAIKELFQSPAVFYIWKHTGKRKDRSHESRYFPDGFQMAFVHRFFSFAKRNQLGLTTNQLTATNKVTDSQYNSQSRLLAGWLRSRGDQLSGDNCELITISEAASSPLSHHKKRPNQTKNAFHGHPKPATT